MNNMDEPKVFLKDIMGVIDNNRIKLDEEVFITRHLPTIAKHGKPTEALQKELTLVAGGESKRINLVDSKGKKILTLPSANSSGGIINSVENNDFKINKKMPIDAPSTDREIKKSNKGLEVVFNNMDKLATSWDYVLEHYKDKIAEIEEGVKPEVKKDTKSKMKLDITEDEYNYDE